jgi:hypothetical protein
MRQNKLTALFIAFIYSSSLICGMDQPTITDNESLAWEIALKNGVALFNYRKINRLAVCSKKLDLIVCKTASDRKQYLQGQCKLSGDVVWHKHGAMCGAMWHDKYQRMYRRLFYLNKHTIHNQTVAVYEGKFCKPLPLERQSFFNNQSDFCFYGYGDRGFRIDEISGKVIAYYLCASHRPGEISCRQAECLIKINSKKSSLLGLDIFLEFPVLLNAFLQSTAVEMGKLGWDYWYEIYHIAGVTIPKNYKEHKQYFSRNKYSSFDDLPKYVRKAVEKQRALSKEKKHKMGAIKKNMSQRFDRFKG